MRKRRLSKPQNQLVLAGLRELLRHPHSEPMALPDCLRGIDSIAGIADAQAKLDYLILKLSPLDPW